MRSALLSLPLTSSSNHIDSCLNDESNLSACLLSSLYKEKGDVKGEKGRWILAANTQFSDLLSTSLCVSSEHSVHCPFEIIPLRSNLPISEEMPNSPTEEPTTWSIHTVNSFHNDFYCPFPIERRISWNYLSPFPTSLIRWLECVDLSHKRRCLFMLDGDLIRRNEGKGEI